MITIPVFVFVLLVICAGVVFFGLFTFVHYLLRNEYDKQKKITEELQKAKDDFIRRQEEAILINSRFYRSFNEAQESENENES